MYPHNTASPNANKSVPERTRKVQRAATLRVRGLKYCPTCESALPLTEFKKNASRYDGLSSQCRICVRESRRRIEADKRASSIGQGAESNCWYCGEELTAETRTVDHLVSRVRGGSDDPSNLVASCQSCNSAKNHRSLEEFRAIRRRQQNGIPYFSRKQLRFFEEHNIDIPEGEPFLFWFEREGRQHRPEPDRHLIEEGAG